MNIIKLLVAGALLMIVTQARADTAPATCTFADTSGACSQVRYRKNIDELTDDELAAYKHAVAVMKTKSAQNIFERTGFLWQAWVHNCTNIPTNDKRTFSVSDISTVDSCDLSTFDIKEKRRENPGMCEHAKDTFLQWHRAEFYFYEKALQAADPEGKTGPSTKNVTVPYWNFTKKPSGQRYPKAFEDPDSPLFNSNRIHTPLSSPLPYTSPYLLAYMIYFLDWPEFGGYPAGSAGNYGALEAQIHNDMHDLYVGGFMKSPRTAGLEPVFYSFHAFLDYSFERWIEEHGSNSITSAKYFLRGEQDDDLPKPVNFSEGSGSKRPGKYTKNMGRGEIYFDTRRQGYAYQAGRDGEFIPRSIIQTLVDRHEQAGFEFGDGSMSLFSELLSYGSAATSAHPAAVLTIPVTISVVPAKSAMLTLVRKSKAHDYDFHVDIYLHPKTVAPDIENQEFRDKYLASNTTYWALSGHHQEQATPLAISSELNKVFNSLVRRKAGQEWQVTVAIGGDTAIKAADFDKPTLTLE